MKIAQNDYGRQYVKDYKEQQRGMKIYHLKLKVKSFLKKLLFWSIVIICLAGVVQYFRWAYPTEVIVEKEVLINQEITYPVLERIAECESGNSQYGKTGQVLVMGNTNKSVDIGKYQINNVIWGKKATEMGLNLMVEKDNEAFAVYLYKTYGTEPWVFSKKCWSK